MSGVWDWCHIILVVGVELDTMSGAVHLGVMTDRHSVSQNGHNLHQTPEPLINCSCWITRMVTRLPHNWCQHLIFMFSSLLSLSTTLPSSPMPGLSSPLLCTPPIPTSSPTEWAPRNAPSDGSSEWSSGFLLSPPTSQLLSLHNYSVTSLLQSLNTEF